MASPHVHDATDADFDTAVIARSRATPVLVDFWAPWCGPCRVLGPVLEQVAAEYEGKVEVVKVDTDQNPGVAGRYGIRSIPAVKLFKGGEVAGEFVGALPAGQVRAFLDDHLPGPADDAMAAATAAFAAGRLDEADAAAAQVPGRARAYDAAQALRAVVALARQADGASVDEAAAAVAAAPDDVAARFRHACALIGASRWAEALDALLGVVERDRRWNGEAGRKAMLAIFAVIGVRSPVSDAYRKKLAVLL